MKKKIHLYYSRTAEKELLALPKKTAKRILEKIVDNVNQKDPLLRAKPLQGILGGKYRYRVGDYRVIFKIEASGRISILMVLNIKHRKDIYR